jgi:hypothetical protein
MTNAYKDEGMRLADDYAQAAAVWFSADTEQDLAFAGDKKATARAALEAHLSKGGVPEGWKLVPSIADYDRMLSASPLPSPAPQEGVTPDGVPGTSTACAEPVTARAASTVPTVCGTCGGPGVIHIYGGVTPCPACPAGVLACGEAQQESRDA